MGDEVSYHPITSTPTSSIVAICQIKSRRLHFITRTQLLLTIGLDCGHLFFPGGLGTIEEAASSLLSEQLREDVLTAMSHCNIIPHKFFINCNGSPYENYWEGLQRQLSIMVEVGAVDSSVNNTIHFIDLSDPERDAQNIVDLACAADDGILSEQIRDA